MSNNSALDKEYLETREQYCESMQKVIQKFKEVVSVSPRESGLYDKLMQSSGIVRQVSEDLADYEARFEEEMFITCEEYVNDFMTNVGGIISEAESSVNKAIAAVPLEADLEPEMSGSAFDDFQHTIHEGPEKKVGTLLNYLPRNEELHAKFKSTKDDFHTAATNLIQSSRLDELSSSERSETSESDSESTANYHASKKM